MIRIERAVEKDATLLSAMGSRAFLESHGHGATPEANLSYVRNKLSPEAFLKELVLPDVFFHLIYVNGEPAGYSKIILNTPNPNIEEQRVTKLERLYLLEAFYGMQLGQQLFDHNLKLAQENHQRGIWLYVWKENHRAIAFYLKQGFSIVGSYDFEIAPGYCNPNNVMYLKFYISS
jgi:ribosomal protein S18 acetylase RimI-like enzyme